MKKLLTVLSMYVLSLSGCKTETGVMTRIATFQDGAQLRQLYDQHHAPLVIVGHGVYLPPDECLCKKATGSPAPSPSSAPPVPPTEETAVPSSGSHINTDGHKYGGEAEQRVIGGFAEQRVFGGGSLPIKCTTRGDCRGFQVLIPLGGEVRYFDGARLVPASDGFVPIAK